MPISDYLKNLRRHIGKDLVLMPAVAALVFNKGNEVLLQRRSDNGLWGLPGGAIDPQETPAQAIVREVYEETGLIVKPERLVGHIKQHTIYPNGDEVEMHIATFHCTYLRGKLESRDGESLDLRYFSKDALPPSKVLEPYPKELFDVNYKGSYFAWDDSFLNID